MNTEAIYEAVRERYAQAARGSSCCGTKASSEPGIGSANYDGAAPSEGALAASLGCGNPTAMIELHDGDVVLDLGSGGGLDVLLSARRVAPNGRAYGLDMTDEMLALARRNQAEAGVTNAEFLKGTIEQMPLPDGTIDVIISNCVVNLSPDKDRVFAEAYRVLKPGGRVAISDIVSEVEMPAEIQQRLGLWGACVAGALSLDAYRAKLESAGFRDVAIQVTREHGEEYLGPNFRAVLGGDIYSAFVRATK